MATMKQKEQSRKSGEAAAIQAAADKAPVKSKSVEKREAIQKTPVPEKLVASVKNKSKTNPLAKTAKKLKEGANKPAKKE